MIYTAHVTGQETSAQIFHKTLKYNSILHTGRLKRQRHERDARSLTADTPCSCLLARRMRDNGGWFENAPVYLQSGEEFSHREVQMERQKELESEGQEFLYEKEMAGPQSYPLGNA